jgi:hypothetical protein
VNQHLMIQEGLSVNEFSSMIQEVSAVKNVVFMLEGSREING